MTASADAVDSQPPVTVRVFSQCFSSTRRGARLARLLAIEQLHTWGIAYDSDFSCSAAQIVAELVANAVTHGLVPGRDFELRLALDGRVLRIAVSDARGERLPRARRTANTEDSGRGLLVVAALALRWGVEPRRPCGKRSGSSFPSLSRSSGAALAQLWHRLSSDDGHPALYPGSFTRTSVRLR